MKTILLAMTAAVSAVAFADTFTWTGAEDASWTNPANWTVGGAVATRCPGVPVSDDTAAMWAAWESENDTAVFSGAGNGHTTIDLAGLHCISAIVVSGAQTPVYTFGSSDEQRLRIRVGGSFTLAADAAAAPVFTAGIVLGVGARWMTGESSTVVTSIPFYNESELELTFGDLYQGERTPDAVTSGKAYNYVLALCGTGPMVLAGEVKNQNLTHLSFDGSGKVRIESVCNFARWRMGTVVTGTTGDIQIEIVENAEFGVPDYDNSGFMNGVSQRSVVFTGAGVWKLRGMSADKPSRISFLKMKNTGSFIVSSGFDVYDGQPLFLKANGTGDTPTIEFTDEADNRMTGPVYWYQCPYTVKAVSIGANGVKSALGSGSDIRIAIGGKLAYTGPGEETTRTLTLTNTTEASSKAGGILSQQGTGPWVFSSEIRPWYSASSASATLGLDNATDFPATLNSSVSDGPIPLALTKTGAGLWTIGGVNAYTGPTTVSAGTLAFAAGGSIDASSAVALSGGASLVFAPSAEPVTKTLKAVTVAGAVSTLTVGAGVTLVLDGVPTASGGGRLDIVAPDGASVTCPAAAGRLLPYSQVRLNDRPVCADAEGRLSFDGLLPTVRVDVRGGVIESDAASVVGFYEAGESGPVTLGSSAVQVSAVAQDLTVSAATVALAAGQSLSAGILSVAEDAADLAIGADRTTGAFVVPADGLFLDNASEDATLAVRAPLSGTGTFSIGKDGVGTAELPLVTAFSSTLSVLQGTLLLADGAGTALHVSRPDDAEEASAVTFANAATAMTLTHAAPEGAVDISGASDAARRLALTVAAGEVRLTGEGVKNVGDVTVAAGATLKIDGGAEVSSTDTTAFTINGRAEISGATQVNPAGATVAGGSADKGGIALKDGGYLVIGDGALVSNKVIVGYMGESMVKQTGGKVFALSNSGGSAKYCSALGYPETGKTHCGYYLKTGGEFFSSHYLWLNEGLFEHAGGTMSVVTVALGGNVSASCRPHFLLTGGTVTISSANLSMGWTTSNESCTLTIDGETASMTVGGPYNGISGGKSAKPTVNLNKGRLLSSFIMPKEGGTMHVNFNGGTYAAVRDNGDQNYFTGATRVTVYEGGAIFDLNDKRELIVGGSLLAAPGNGVESVEMPETEGWASVPNVEIAGDGEGATACAWLDPDTGVLKGIRITSPGWNYTWAEAVLRVRGVEQARYACTLKPNRRGPLTIQSSSRTYEQLRLYLDASNEVSKIKIDAGIVMVEADGAIPADADLEINGTSIYDGIDFGDRPIRVGSLGGHPDKCRIICTATNALGQIVIAMDHPSDVGFTGTLGVPGTVQQPFVLSADGAWELTSAQVAGWNADPAAPTYPVYGWDFAFADTASVVVSTPEGLDEDVRYTIFRVAEGKTLTGLPSFTFADGDTHGWRLRRRGNSLCLKHEKGLTLIVR